MECLGRLSCQFPADPGHFGQVLFSFGIGRCCRHFRGKVTVAQHKIRRSFKYKGDALIEISFVAFGSRYVFEGFFSFRFYPGRPESEPFLCIGTNMSLRMILLIDLYNFADSICFSTDFLSDLVFECMALPERINIFAEVFNIPGADLKLILRTARQSLEFLIDPRNTRFRESNACAHTLCAVADNQFILVDLDIEMLEGTS